jgi:hypothetical protein
LICFLWSFLVSWPGLRVSRVNRANLDYFFLSFLNYFFPQNILQHWVDWELGFIIIFVFAFYRVITVPWPLSWVSQVNQVNSSFFSSFFNWIFFFNLILQHEVDWELYFIFVLFTIYRVISVSWSRFVKLTRVDFGYFLSIFYFVFQFNPSLLSWFGIRLHNIIYFLSNRLSRFYNLDSGLGRSTHVFFIFFFIDLFF